MNEHHDLGTPVSTAVCAATTILSFVAETLPVVQLLAACVAVVSGCFAILRGIVWIYDRFLRHDRTTAKNG